MNDTIHITVYREFTSSCFWICFVMDDDARCDLIMHDFLHCLHSEITITIVYYFSIN